MAARPHDADEPDAVEPEAVDVPRHDRENHRAEDPQPDPSAPLSPAAADDAAGSGAVDSASAPTASAPADSAPTDSGPTGDVASDGGPSGDVASDGVPTGDVASDSVRRGGAQPADTIPALRGQGSSDRHDRIPDDVEARWLELVAQLTEPNDLPGDAAPGAQTAASPLDRARVVRPATPQGPREWSPDPAVEEAEDHFEPPEPGPVLAGDPLLTMAWSAVAGVPALLLVAVVAWRDIPSVVLEVAGVAFLGAVGLLVWRMPRHRDDDSGPGAVV